MFNHRRFEFPIPGCQDIELGGRKDPRRVNSGGRSADQNGIAVRTLTIPVEHETETFKRREISRRAKAL